MKGAGPTKALPLSFLLPGRLLQVLLPAVPALRVLPALEAKGRRNVPLFQYPLLALWIVLPTERTPCFFTLHSWVNNGRKKVRTTPPDGG
jgi:hypothetical protein